MKYDVCIVGSGAGGAPIAYELSNAGFNVVVLEKGKYYKEQDINKDELAVSRRDMFTPLLKDEQHVINDNEDGKITRYEGAKYNWSFWNGSMVGGSSNLMSGYFHRMKPNDFKLLSTYGKIEGANVVDWAISYEDLEPYYEKVERLIGVSGDVQQHKFLEPRSTKNFPYKALQTSEVSKWFDKACAKLDIENFETPRAILPNLALKRYGCSYSNFCGSYACATGAKGSARAALLQKCNAKIITQAFVYKLDSTKKKITKVHYYDKDLKSHEIEAKIFVLAAQAIETSRLLLNSKNKYFPNGMANNSSQVGKNLIFSAG
jgi:choline dehydrogenase-like flavoprotein